MNLNFELYQQLARGTAIYPSIGKNFIYPTLGLLGEAGEVAEKIKKIIRDEGGIITEEKRNELAKELGDVLWYLANIAEELRLNLHDIAKLNISKLQSRKTRETLSGNGDNR